MNVTAYREDFSHLVDLSPHPEIFSEVTVSYSHCKYLFCREVWGLKF